MRHIEVPKLGVELELQPLAYTTATVIRDLSHCVTYTTAQAMPDPNPLSEARDRTCILMDTSQICFCCATVGTPYIQFLKIMTNDSSIILEEQLKSTTIMALMDGEL